MSHNLLANLPCTSLIHRISSRRYKEKMQAINRIEGIKIIINNNSSLKILPAISHTEPLGTAQTVSYWLFTWRNEDPRRRITRLLS